MDSPMSFVSGPVIYIVTAKKTLGATTFAREGPSSDDMQPVASIGCPGGWLEMLNQSVPILQTAPEAYAT
eukprot:scaffold67545_cov60-Phaeocystis_antarctica.AAC.3